MSEPALVRIAAEDPQREAQSLCWNCRTEVRGEPQCPSCVKLQPLGRNSDYFSVMGLPRKLDIDARVLEPVFHALSRRFHPDVYRAASGRERVIALENSALLNQAYRTLRDPVERAAYLVQLEEGRAQETRDSPPSELFDAILEVQELLGEFKFADPDEKEALRPRVEAARDAFQAALDHRSAELTGRLFKQWDALQEAQDAPAERKQALLTEIRSAIGERSYIRRMLNSLTEALLDA
jgi:molecular chaperone HscB